MFMEFLEGLAEHTLAVLCQALKKLNKEHVLSRYPALFEELEELSADEVNKAKEIFINNSRETISAERYSQIISQCENTSVAVALIELCLAELYFPAVGNVLKDAFATQSPTLEIASKLINSTPDYTQMEKAHSYVSCFLSAQRNNQPFFRQEFSADERLMGFLCGNDTLDRTIRGFTQFSKHTDSLQPLFADNDIAEDLSSKLSSDDIIVHLSGGQGRGKKLLAQHAFQYAGKELIVVDFSSMVALPEMQRTDAARRIRREAMLYNAGVCFCHINEADFSHLGSAEFIKLCAQPIHNQKLPLCLCTDTLIALVPVMESYIVKYTLKSLDRSKRIAIWKGYCDRYCLNQLDCDAIGSKFKLSARDIAKAAERLSHIKGDKPLTEHIISAVCSEVFPPPTQGSIKKIEATYTLDDLKLPGEQIKLLQNICAHVWHRRRVYDEWNLDSKYPYGKNVSALFVGAPGTGKTMAVHVLSNMLDIPLYRIDLSQVVDKYIGETEKRLEEIFKIAEKSNTILFFDEADSIFGKRSEVNDSKDKYANTEVSYILQRIEQYDGIVILATNYKKNIDEAFMRRMRYLVEFQLPSVLQRNEIWRSCFTKETPVSNIDFDYLSEQFELSGGSIKNIVLNAAFLAAEQDEFVGMQHLLRSVKQERLKLGKAMIRQDFGIYADLI